MARKKFGTKLCKKYVVKNLVDYPKWYNFAVANGD